MAWLNPMQQRLVTYRDGDTLISLRSGGDASFTRIYNEVPWVEFVEYPGQTPAELLARWDALPVGVRRGFKTHASPGHVMDFHPSVKYLVVMRNPEEAIASFHPFIGMHSDEAFELWAPVVDVKAMMYRTAFADWFNDVLLPFQPPGAPPIPGGGINLWFASFINAWWPLRHEPNVFLIHYADLKRDHEGSIRKIADFLGVAPTAEQWPKILEHTSFAWMKAHEDKFEGISAGFPGKPVELLKHGAMVRKGQVGAAKDDGITPEISATIREWMEKLVPDKDALRFMYEGGEKK